VGVGDIAKGQKKYASVVVLKAGIQIVSSLVRVPERLQ
jgi:hypothetical protein